MSCANGTCPGRLFLEVALAFCLIASARASVPAADGGAPVPVIDMHVHVFNARDLPVVGALEALGVPSPVAKVVGKILLRWTPADDGPSPSMLYAASPGMDPTERAQVLAYLGDDIPVSYSTFSGGVAGKDRLLVAAVLAKAQFPPDESGHGVPAAGSDAAIKLSMANLSGYLRFIDVVTSKHPGVIEKFKEVFAPAGATHRVDFMIAHMMDMAIAYAEKPKNKFSDQDSIMRKLDEAHAQDLVHFTAYDPFRREKALSDVQKSFRDGRALGVKFYPPSGYRPTGNDYCALPADDNSHAEKRYESRYKNFPESELDDTIDKFFAWAVAEDVPVFTHFNPWGFQVAQGYGMVCNDPRYWRAVLRKYPKLRLCFGHAGGEPFWFNDRPASAAAKSPTEGQLEWDLGAAVVELCRTYPNVYCEVGYLNAILKPESQPAFKQKLAAVLGKTDDSHPYDFAAKIMYGTDWFMIHKEEGISNYLKTFDAVIVDVDPSLQRPFFSGNAVRYLRLDCAEVVARFTEDQRSRFATFAGVPKPCLPMPGSGGR